jgi:hypothetical protein
MEAEGNAECGPAMNGPFTRLALHPHEGAGLGIESYQQVRILDDNFSGYLGCLLGTQV